MKDSINPILVEVIRGDMVESFHRGAAIVVNEQGETVAAFGDVNRPIYPRSAIKPLQAIVLAESGALERYKLGNEQIALACASHSGESRHVNGVRRWLEKIGLDETALECGVQHPSHHHTRIEMIREGIEANSLHNNCSGKHAGFITVAKHNDVPIKGYVKRSHPVQQSVLKVLQELTEEPLQARPFGTDGCGIPVVGISLHGIASAFRKLASGNFDSIARQNSAHRICSAMAEFPELVGGENRFCTAVPLATHGRVLIKVGAEGMYAGMTVDSNPLGFALKIDDGSRRAAEIAMGWLISKFCDLDTEITAELKPWLQPEVKTVANISAGVIRPSIQ